MKRSDTKRPVKRTGDVRKDLTQNQLAWIGSIALAYNETERLVDVIFGISLSLSELSYDVVSRINGTEGRVEIIKLAIRELGCPELMCVAFADTLGNNGFSLLKKFRDRIIHASIVDAAAAIARSPAKRGSFEEVLLTVDALKALYRRMQLVRSEMIEIMKITSNYVLAKSPANTNLNLLAGRGVPIAQIESEILRCFAQFHRHQKARLSLPPLPEFPSEPELNAADERALQERQGEVLKRVSLMRAAFHELDRIQQAVKLPDLTEQLSKIVKEKQLRARQPHGIEARHK
jgi:hypothetical protein